MSERERPPVMFRLVDRPPDDLDRLLRDFFRSEMPYPWPRLAAPVQEGTRPLPPRPRRWAGLRRRLCVAASVGLLLTGYLFLAQTFPGSRGGNAGPGPEVDQARIGSRLPVKKLPQRIAPDRPKVAPATPRTVTTPGGGEYRLWEQHRPGEGVLIQVEEIRPKGGR
jgi:hypothetical protein